MSRYITNPETGRQIKVGGRTHKQLLHAQFQRGGSADPTEGDQFDDDELQELLQHYSFVNPLEHAQNYEDTEATTAHTSLGQRQRDLQDAYPRLTGLLAQGNPRDRQILLRILDLAKDNIGWDYSDLITDQGIDPTGTTLDEKSIANIIEALKPANMSILEYIDNLRQ